MLEVNIAPDAFNSTTAIFQIFNTVILIVIFMIMARFILETFKNHHN